ncbi:hypothetical protein [Paenarthrobacter sp. NPDC090522]|uniref:hypothetical protein n=1 Tax=Paenarthrobacter sp. NPDC090522 TaxID=3364383 RepID=UPI0037F59C0F
MDTGQLVLIIVVAVIVIAAVIIAVVVGRRKKTEANRRRAVDLREKADQEAVGAHQAKVESAQAEAAAVQAEAEANRLRREAERHSAQAKEASERVDEHLRHADKVDPDVRTTKDGTRTSEQARTDDDVRAQVAEPQGQRLTRDRTGRNAGIPDGTRHDGNVAEGTTREESVRGRPLRDGDRNA